MASRRRTAEDKNTKLLRELATLPHNKQCFDCLQRGPTYINVTIGSFVCTTCSGILRGLTPPHRVKSISMTTFTPEEIEFLRNRGNEYCKFVWLGTFDTNSNSIESEIYNDQKKRDFMIQKYEKKRWYVDPDVAIKKMQSSGQLRHKANMTQSQSLSTKSTTLPETQPLSRLLGKSVTPLVVQNNQSGENWPHPVSSASAPTISTKTSSQNHGSRSIDLLSEFAKENSTANSQGSSTANGNFANFENAFSSVEKSAGNNVAAPSNMPTSASLDAYPMQTQQNQQKSFHAFSPTSPPNPKTSATPVNSFQQTTADRYAALADLDSLFNQPASTKAPSWTVEVTSSGSFFDTPATSEKAVSNLYSTAPSNPFASSNIWNQQSQQPTQNSYQSANPFQNITESGLTYTQATSSQAYAPFPIPMVGNSPSDDGARNQFNANFSTFPNQMVSSPTNGYGQSQLLYQNGVVTSPTTSSGMWNVPMWSSSHAGQNGGLFSNEIKTMEPAQHSDWIQNPVNPFTMSSSNIGYSVTPKSNCSNPFL